MKRSLYVLIPLFIFLGFLTWQAWQIFWPLQPANETLLIKIKYGLGPSEIAFLLHSKRIISDADDFIKTVRLFGENGSLRAGMYELPARVSAYQAMKILTTGKQHYIKVTIPEGWQTRQIAARFARELDVDSTRFMTLVDDTSFARQKVNAPSLHGFLYPETYFFTYGVNEKHIIERLIREFNQNIPDTLRLEGEKLGFSFHEILTLASIIEGEAMLENEMNIISSVFHNRLERGIPLQADPTIQYIIPDGPRRLLNRDLEIDSPYNTYRVAGLPPGPINNPSALAIKAALYPADTPYLYFVADGTGAHTFSTTLSQHLNAKAKFDKIRKRVAREQKNSN